MVFFVFFFFAKLHGLQDLSSWNRDWAQALQSWNRQVLTTGLPGNSQHFLFNGQILTEAALILNEIFTWKKFHLKVTLTPLISSVCLESVFFYTRYQTWNNETVRSESINQWRWKKDKITWGHSEYKSKSNNIRLGDILGWQDTDGREGQGSRSAFLCILPI